MMRRTFTTASSVARANVGFIVSSVFLSTSLQRILSTDRSIGKGLGNMGRGMALNLIKAGHSLTVFDGISVSISRLLPLPLNDGG